MKIQSVPWVRVVPDGQIIRKLNASSPLYKFYFSITLHFAKKKRVTLCSRKRAQQLFVMSGGTATGMGGGAEAGMRPGEGWLLVLMHDFQKLNLFF